MIWIVASMLPAAPLDTSSSTFLISIHDIEAYVARIKKHLIQMCLECYRQLKLEYILI